MRSQKSYLALVLILVVAAAWLVAGCGGDDTPVSNGNSIGNPTNPEFVVIDGHLSNLADSTVNIFQTGLGGISSINVDDQIDPVRYVVAPGTVNDAGSSYSDGWHVVWATVTASGGAATLRDSIQFRNAAGTPIQTTADLSSMTVKHAWEWDVLDTTISHEVVSGNSAFIFVGLDGQTATINGENLLSVSTKTVTADSTVWRTLTIDSDVVDVTVAKTGSGWAQGCPSTGTISGTIEMSYKKDDAAAVGSSWTFTLTFNAGTVTQSVTKGTVTWTSTRDVCADPAA